MLRCGQKTSSATINEKMLAINTAAAEMSLSSLILGWYSVVCKSARTSILVFTASKDNTNVAETRIQSHSCAVNFNKHPRIKAIVKRRNCIRAFLLSVKRVFIPTIAVFNEEKKFVCFMGLKLVKKGKMT